MKKIFFLIWCLPQNILGIILKMFIKTYAKYKIDGATFYESNLTCGSVSLGNYIFLCINDWGEDYMEKHEYGHYRQSLILGPLYLIIIGLPSIIWNACFKSYRKKHNISYYNFYTEKWANKLGGN